MKKININWPDVKTLSWNLTYRCNFTCPHCYINANCPKDDINLNLELFTKIVKDAKANNIKIIFLAGGEPLILKELPKYISEIQKEGLEPFICSNLSLLTKDLVKQLINVGLKGICVGIEYTNKKGYEGFRKGGSYEQLIKNMKICKDEGLDLGIDFTLTKQNKKSISEIHKFAIENGAKQVSLKRFNVEGRGLQNKKELQLEPLEYRSCLMTWLKNSKFYENKITSFVHDPMYLTLLYEEGLLKETDIDKYGCKASGFNNGWLGISPNGDIHPCPLMTSIILGNISKNTIKQSLNNRLCKKIAFTIPEKCKKCPTVNFCRGGCKNCSLRTTSINEPDIMCWRLKH